MGYLDAQFVELALQTQVNDAGLELDVDVSQRPKIKGPRKRTDAAQERARQTRGRAASR